MAFRAWACSGHVPSHLLLLDPATFTGTAYEALFMGLACFYHSPPRLDWSSEFLVRAAKDALVLQCLEMDFVNSLCVTHLHKSVAWVTAAELRPLLQEQRNKESVESSDEEDQDTQ